MVGRWQGQSRVDHSCVPSRGRPHPGLLRLTGCRRSPLLPGQLCGGGGDPHLNFKGAPPQPLGTTWICWGLPVGGLALGPRAGSISMQSFFREKASQLSVGLCDLLQTVSRPSAAFIPRNLILYFIKCYRYFSNVFNDFCFWHK